MKGRKTAWRMPEVTADGLKIFACVVMLIQTVGILIVEKGLIGLSPSQAELAGALAEDSRLMTQTGIGSAMQLAGGMALPVFAFLLVEGFLHTSDYKKYLFRIAFAALVSEIPFDLVMSQKIMDWSVQNALITMTVCLLMLYFIRMTDAADNRLLRGIIKTMAVMGTLIWVSLFRAQYGLSMVLLTAIFYLLHAHKVWKTVLGALVSFLHVTGPLAFFGIWCYNGKRSGLLPKYVYYIFYPAHLLLGGLVTIFFLS